MIAANTVMGPEQEPIDPEWLIAWSMRYNRGGHNAQYIYNFRVDAEDETCVCGDAAKWPTKPNTPRYIGDTTKVDIYDDAGVLTGSSYVEIG